MEDKCITVEQKEEQLTTIRNEKLVFIYRFGRVIKLRDEQEWANEWEMLKCGMGV